MSEELTYSSADEVERLQAEVAQLRHGQRDRDKLVAQLRASEDRYRKLIEQMPDAVVVHCDGHLVFVNDAALKLWRATGREQLLGRHFNELVSRGAQEEAVRGADAGVIQEDHQLVRPDGSVADVDATSIPCTFDGKPCVQTILRDVSPRKLAQRALRETTRQYEDLVNTIDGIVWEADARTFQFKFVSRQAERLLGYPIHHWLNEPKFWVEHIHPNDRDQAVQFCLTATREKRDHSFQYRMIAADGRDVWLRDIVTVVIEGDQVVSLRGLMLDVTELMRTDEALRRAKLELEARVEERTQELSRKNDELQEKQQFLQQMLKVHERDRQLVAYEIHDTFLQDIIAGLMFVESFRAGRHNETDPQWEELERIRKLLVKAIDDARRLISGLRPPIIDEEGIIGAIDYLVSEFKQRGLQIRFVHEMQVTRLPAAIEGTIFRIVQEALNNLERHSKADFGEVELRQVDRTMRIVIRDSGIGFDPLKIPDGHFGLQGIKERARLVGGTVEIESAPSRGTKISVEIPISLPD